jgi:hypothetical protein
MRTSTSSPVAFPFFSLFALLLFALVGACSSSTETVPATVTLDPTVAKSQASALTAAARSAAANSGAGIATALATAANASAALVPGAKGGANSQIGAAGAATTCTCPAGATGCTFTGCTVAGATVSGTLSWGGGKLTCDKLTFSAAAKSAAIGAVDVVVDCAFTYTATSLDGSLHTTGSADVDQVTYTWDATLDATSVTFTPSAFTGGAIAVDANVTGVSTARGTESYVGNAVVSLP